MQWIRNTTDVYAFHVPLGWSEDRGSRIRLPLAEQSSVGRIEMSNAILDLKWNQLLMYPAGYFSRDIPYARPSHCPPDGSMRRRWRG